MDKSIQPHDTIPLGKGCSMKVQELVDQYVPIVDFLNERWPLKDKQQRVFARTMKLVEELGELSDEILTSMNLQRAPKMSQFSQENVEDEFADVLATVIMLGIELDIDVPKVMEKKIRFTRERFEMDQAQKTDTADHQ